MLDRLAASRLRLIYDLMPERVKEVYRRAKFRPKLHEYVRTRSGLAQTERILGPLKDAYLGKRVVLMGNGPSLRQTDWSLLEDEYTIGLNRIYLLHPEMGFYPSFYVCVNALVIDQFATDILGIPSVKLIDWEAASKLEGLPEDAACIPSLPTHRFRPDIRRGWHTGGTVTFPAMQLAYYLGFRRVILIGVDHRFQSAGPANKVVESEGEDPDHCHPDYFGKGVKWQLPDLEESERSYVMARTAFGADGREIVDCTAGGELAVFPKRNLGDMLR